MSFFASIRRDFHRSSDSIKLIEVEETFDIYFSRFFGYYLALLAKGFKMTPNQVSLISLATGIVAGYFFYFQDNIVLILLACFFVTLSGVIDSADGQLARMTGKSSEIGRIIDGTIDTAVFAACYVGAIVYFIQTDYGVWVLPIAVLAGYSHSVKSAVYEYYKAEFIYYVKGAKDQRIPFTDEIVVSQGKPRWIYKFLYYLEKDYTRKQLMFNGRTKESRKLFEKWAFNENRERFCLLYTQLNKQIMTWYAWVCGTNVHRTVLMVSSIFGRMDLYFYYSIITIVFLIPLVRYQKRIDRKLLKDFS